MDYKLPGAIILELDVDGDINTGSSGGMCSMGRACIGTGEKIKGNVAGLDVSLWIAFDDQDDDSITAWCRDCEGQLGNCFYKDTPCDDAYTGGLGDCGTEHCYVAQNPSCSTGDNNCFLAGDTCQPIGADECAQCMEMVDICPDPEDCANGRYRGEWFAVTLQPAQQVAPYHARGKIDLPLPPLGGPDGIDSEMSITLPWRRIVEKLKTVGGGTYDLVAAQDPANLTWQLLVLEDGIVGGNDYIDAASFCLNVVDVIPDSVLLQVQAGHHTCSSE